MGPTPPTILLVDPDDAGVRGVADGLEAAGFRAVVVADGASALGRLQDMAPDLVLLELVLPDQPGLEVCRQIRERSPVPIVVVTDIDSELEVAVALEIGADDYVVKPVDLREMLARIRGLLRRAEEKERRRRRTTALEVGGVHLDLAAHTVLVSGRRVDLTLKEFAVLRILLERAGRIVSRRALLQDVWGPGSEASRSATLDAHMKRLRAKLEGGGAANSRITTFRKLGYRYETEAPH